MIRVSTENTLVEKPPAEQVQRKQFSLSALGGVICLCAALSVNAPYALSASFLGIHAENRARTAENQNSARERSASNESQSRSRNQAARERDRSGRGRGAEEEELDPLRLPYPGSQIPNYGTRLENRLPITDELRRRYLEHGIDLDNLPPGQQFVNGYILNHTPYQFEERNPEERAFIGFGIASGGVGSNDQEVAEWREFVESYYPGKYDMRDPEVARYVRNRLRAPAPWKPIEFEPFDADAFAGHFLDFIGYDEQKQRDRLQEIQDRLLRRLDISGPDHHFIDNIRGSYALDRSRLTDTRRGVATERTVNPGERRRATISVVADESAPQTGEFERWVEMGWHPIEQQIKSNRTDRNGRMIVEIEVLWQATDGVRGVPR